MHARRAAAFVARQLKASVRRQVSRPNRCVLVAALVGCTVPIFWSVLAFIYFSAPESAWTDLFWDAVYISCPPWLLPENSLSWFLTPVLNAGLYAVAGYVFFRIGHRVPKGNEPDAA